MSRVTVTFRGESGEEEFDTSLAEIEEILSGGCGTARRALEKAQAAAKAPTKYLLVEVESRADAETWKRRLERHTSRRVGEVTLSDSKPGTVTVGDHEIELEDRTGLARLRFTDERAPYIAYIETDAEGKVFINRIAHVNASRAARDGRSVRVD